MTDKKDQLYSQQQSDVERFTFDERVAEVFQDMITRSVPGYQQILEMLPTLVRYCEAEQNDKALYYDLGCSLGAGMLAMAQGLEQSRNIIGIDNSSAMLEQAKKNLSLLNSTQKFELLNRDINDCDFKHAAMVLMNFTLQFVPMEQRSTLIKRIYTDMNQGGMLVLSEKLHFSDSLTEQALINIHHQYKAEQGYSQLEIAQKRDAIENVLLPETLDVHTLRLRSAGFKVVTPWVQNLQFVSILAIK